MIVQVNCTIKLISLACHVGKTNPSGIYLRISIKNNISIETIRRRHLKNVYLLEIDRNGQVIPKNTFLESMTNGILNYLVIGVNFYSLDLIEISRRASAPNRRRDQIMQVLLYILC